MIYRIARPALFALDPEHAHELTLKALAACPSLARPFRADVADRSVELAGIRFRNRVGLAAGLDKDARCLQAWDAFGFGFVEVGTVTPRPQIGNPRPRLFRVPEHSALINRLGFNNLGVDALVREVSRRPIQATLGINIGKNADTPIERAADDYLHCLRKVYPHAGYITVNISSPNTRNLRDLQQAPALDALLATLMAERSSLAQQLGRQVPVFLKVAPDNDAAALAGMSVLARERGVDGLIVSNTTITRPGLEGHALAGQGGGLSGAPLRPLAEAALRVVRGAVGADFPLIGVGGIESGTDASARRRAGADLVQIYTGFIYRGPELVAECRRALQGD